MKIETILSDVFPIVSLSFFPNGDHQGYITQLHIYGIIFCIRVCGLHQFDPRYLGFEGSDGVSGRAAGP